MRESAGRPHWLSVTMQFTVPPYPVKLAVVVLNTAAVICGCSLLCCTERKIDCDLHCCSRRESGDILAGFDRAGP